jgi:hypothetical protein
MNAPEADVNCRYDILDMGGITVATDLIARTFSRDEPLAVTVGQSL